MNSRRPKISVVVTTFRPGGLDITLSGFRDQTLPKSDFEVVIIDRRYDKRHNEVVALASKYGVSVIHAPEHRRNGKWITACTAMNTGFALARGEFLIILSDYFYVPPRWLEAYLTRLTGHVRKIVLAPYDFAGLPPLAPFKKPWDMAESAQRVQDDRKYGCLEEDEIMKGGVVDEMFIFRDGPFDPSWLANLPLSPGDYNHAASVREKLTAEGQQPEYRWFHLRNEGFYRGLLYAANGIDETLEKTRGPFDIDLAARMEMLGGFFEWCPEIPKPYIINPRFLCRTMPYGNHHHRIEDRWSSQDGMRYHQRRISARLSWAPNPFSIERLATQLSPWRNPETECVPMDVPDLAYWRKPLLPPE